MPPEPPPKLKLVIRRLPPSLPESLFWQTVEPWCGPVEAESQSIDPSSSSSSSSKDVAQKPCVWRKWVQGRKVDEDNLHQIYSRAYVLMTSTERCVEFHRNFDGHAFRSKDGQEYRAVVELAPSQKVPPLAQAMVSAILKGDGKVKQPKIRVDARQGQIDTDNDYLSFVESLAQPLEKPKPEDFVSSAPTATNSTPLLDHLREQRVAKKSALAAAKTEQLAAAKATRSRNGSNSRSNAAPTYNRERELVYGDLPGGKGKKGVVGGDGWDGGSQQGGGGAGSSGKGKGKKGPGLRGQQSSPKSGNANLPSSAQEPGQPKAGPSRGGGQREHPKSPKPQPQVVSILKREPPKSSAPSVPPPNQGRPSQNQNQRNERSGPGPAQAQQTRQDRTAGQRGKNAGGFQASAALLSAALSASTGGAGVKGRNARDKGKQGNVDATQNGGTAPEGGKEDAKRKRVRTRKKPEVGGGGAGAGAGGDAAVNSKDARIDA